MLVYLQVRLFIRNLDDIDSWIKESLEEHRKSYNPDNVNDYIDAYIKESKSHDENKHNSFIGNLTTHVYFQ